MPTEKRTEQVLIRLTESEKERLLENAATAGCSTSELVRQTAVYGAEISPVVLDAGPIAELNFEARKQGGNLNQLMHYLNTYKAGAFDPARVEKILDNVLAVIEKSDALLDSLSLRVKGGCGKP